MKKALRVFVLILFAAASAINGSEREFVIHYHFADREEAVSCFLSNEDYFKGFSPCDLQYKTQDKNGTPEDYKEFGGSQMEEFTDEEKSVMQRTIEEMQADFDSSGYSLPELEEIILIKSTQKEECGSGAYTHGTQIYLGETVLDCIGSDDENDRRKGKYILWHEIFHCLTRDNPDLKIN